MAMKNVIVARSRRTTPDMCSVEAAVLDITEVLHKQRMIRNSAITLWLKILCGIQVRNVDTSSVRSRTILIVFEHVHAEKDNINSMNLLKQSDALGSDGEFRGAPALGVALIHLLKENKKWLEPWTF
jgi:hypothetical protein